MVPKMAMPDNFKRAPFRRKKQKVKTFFFFFLWSKIIFLSWVLDLENFQNHVKNSSANIHHRKKENPHFDQKKNRFFSSSNVTHTEFYALGNFSRPLRAKSMETA